MDICIAGDVKYFENIKVLLYSIFHNNESDVNVYLLVNQGFINKYKDEFSENKKVFIKEISDDYFHKFRLSSFFSYGTYYKVLLDLFIPSHIETLLYLDSDIVVLGDLSPLFSLDMGEYYIAAVEEFAGGNFRKRLKLSDESFYFNAGVLLLDMKKIRFEGLLAETRILIESGNSNLKWLDQDALNIVFDKKWKKLDKIWNFHRYYVLNNILNSNVSSIESENIKIVHYTGKIKPWHDNDINYLKTYYKEYYKMTFAKELELQKVKGLNIENFKVNFIFKNRFLKQIYVVLRKIKHLFLR